MKKNYTVHIKVEKIVPVDVCVESLSTSTDLDAFIENAVDAAWPMFDKLPDEVFRNTEDIEGIKITDDHGSVVWEHHEYQFPSHGTSGGVELTNEVIEYFADEAERGYETPAERLQAWARDERPTSLLAGRIILVSNPQIPKS